LPFYDALVLSEFYRNYSSPNNIIEAVEEEIAEDVDKLLSDTISLLSEIEKFLAVGVAGIQSVGFGQLFEEHVKLLKTATNLPKRFLPDCGRVFCDKQPARFSAA